MRTVQPYVTINKSRCFCNDTTMDLIDKEACLRCVL